ncbi:hypothetical protein P3T39_007334 [Kitasatospora sp. GP82]|nr:hypothetical protein [Kitasatospora sp. GP82]
MKVGRGASRQSVALKPPSDRYSQHPRPRRATGRRLTTTPGPSSTGAETADRRSGPRWSARWRRRWPNDLDQRRRTATITAPRKGPRHGPAWQSQLQESLTPPDAGTPRTGQPGRRPGHRPALEVVVEPGHEPFQIGSRAARKPPQHVFEKFTCHQRITARTGRIRHRHIAPRLSEIPAALGQRRRNGTSPQPVLLHLPHSHARQRRDTVDATDRTTSSGPPPLSAEPLGPPTRHCPFGSTCRHPATIQSQGGGSSHRQNLAPERPGGVGTDRQIESAVTDEATESPAASSPSSSRSTVLKSMPSGGSGVECLQQVGAWSLLTVLWFWVLTSAGGARRNRRAALPGV